MAFFDSTFLHPFGEYYFEPQRKGCSPPLHKTPDYIRQQHRMFHNNTHSLVNANLFYTTTHDIDASKTPLNQLKRITLQDLHMEEATKGGYLILRTIEPAYRMVALTTIVEDHEGNAVLFAIYNYTVDLSPSSVDVFPVGTVFILKEPYIKMSRSKDCMLRCDCPTDIIILHEGHELFKLAEGITWKNIPNPEPKNPVSRCPRPKTAMEWKERGNSLFNDGKLEYATQCYLMAMKEAKNVNNHEDLLVIRLNLSAVYLERGFFEAALDFARIVLGFAPGNPKALLRAGRSCYQLRNYSAAKQYFEVFHKLYPDSEDGAKELDDCKSRVAEQETGEFNMYKMYLEKFFKPGQKIACADYVGHVKVVEIAGKGRGVVATRDLLPGTLVAVSKALAFSWDNTSEVRVQFNADLTAKFGNDIKLVTNVAQAIAKNPNTFGPIVYDLSDGQSVSDGSTVQLFCDPKTKDEPIADVHKIRKILDINCFMAHPTVSYKTTRDGDQKCPEGSGLFTFPSYFNHSCVPNASCIMFNDVLFVRVIRFTKAGEELLISYVPWELAFETRNFFCTNRGFQCICDHCNFERGEPKHLIAKRQEHVYTFRTKFEKRIVSGDVNATLIKNLKKLIKAFDLTYEKYEVALPKFHKLPFYYYLGMACNIQGNQKKEIQCLKEILSEYGFCVEQLITSLENNEPMQFSKNTMMCQIVLHWIENIIYLYHQQGDSKNVHRYIGLLVALEKIYSGGDVNVVRLKYLLIKHLV